jgi:hypothetical protein
MGVNDVEWERVAGSSGASRMAWCQGLRQCVSSDPSALGIVGKRGSVIHSSYPHTPRPSVIPTGARSESEASRKGAPNFCPTSRTLPVRRFIRASIPKYGGFSAPQDEKPSCSGRKDTSFRLKGHFFLCRNDTAFQPFTTLLSRLPLRTIGRSSLCSFSFRYIRRSSF